MTDNEIWTHNAQSAIEKLLTFRLENADLPFFSVKSLMQLGMDEYDALELLDFIWTIESVLKQEWKDFAIEEWSWAKEWVPIVPPPKFKEADYYSDGLENLPFFTQDWYYAFVGNKGDGRTIKAVVREVDLALGVETRRNGKAETLEWKKSGSYYIAYLPNHRLIVMRHPEEGELWVAFIAGTCYQSDRWKTPEEAKEAAVLLAKEHLLNPLQRILG